MAQLGFAYLKSDEHGLYRQVRSLREERVETVSVATDKVAYSFELLHGVPVLWIPSPRIAAVKGRKETIHALLTLATGQKVVTFDKKLIKELWRMGASFTVEAEMTLEISSYMVLTKTGSPLGWPALYEVCPVKMSGVAASE